MNTLFNFSKKGADICILFQNKKMFIVFSFKRFSPKFLKRKRVYAAEVNVKNSKDYNEIFNNLKSWLDSISSEYLFEQLCDAPTRYYPVISYQDLIIDFNVDVDELMILPPSS